MKRALLALVLASCAQPKPRPTTWCNPTAKYADFDVDAQGNRKPTLYGNARCYSCEGASACPPAGDEWCCADRMCSECETSLIDLTHKPDGGAE